MDNDEQISAQEGQQQEQKQQPSAAGQGINNAFRLGKGLFKLGRFGLNRSRKTSPKQPGEEALEAAEAAGKKVVGSILKRYSLFAFGISFFWFLVIFSIVFFILTIIFPSGGIIPDDAKALMPTVAPTATPPPFFNPGGGSNPGTGGGGATPPSSAPPPGPASSDIAQTADNLAKILLANCPVDININNYTCAQAIYNGGILYPDLAYNEIVQSVQINGDLQCVGFVRAAVGGATGVPMPQAGDADGYAKDLPGFTFIPVGGTIAPGDIPVWGQPSIHIAVAAEVFSPTAFRIAEANFDFNGGINNQRIKGTESNLLGWLRKQ